MQVDKEVFAAFAFYGGLLALKMLPMGLLTARQRFTKLVFANPEDAGKKGKVVFNDDDVERVRRAHQNDIENIFLYFIIATLFLFTHPSQFAAVTCFRVFTAVRYAHTFIYLFQVPQPSRALVYFVGLVVQGYMIFRILSYFW